MITEEQKQFKRGKIEASQVAAALGLSPFQTPENSNLHKQHHLP